MPGNHPTITINENGICKAVLLDAVGDLPDLFPGMSARVMSGLLQAIRVFIADLQAVFVGVKIIVVDVHDALSLLVTDSMLCICVHYGATRCN